MKASHACIWLSDQPGPLLPTRTDLRTSDCITSVSYWHTFLAAGGQLLMLLLQWPSSRCQPTSGLTCCPGCCASPTAKRQRSVRLL